MQKKIKEIRSYLAQKDNRKDNISNSTVGWQIDHIFRVIFGITASLQKSNPSEYKSEFNALRIAIFTSGIIPRGKARAPKEVSTKKDIFEEKELVELIEKAEKKLLDFEKLDSKAFFKHPYFGNLNKKQSLKFMKIHTEHHLKIIRDILK